MTKYEGWANYETWNVAKWFSGDDALYHLARKCPDYGAFQGQVDSAQTPDGVSWNSKKLDISALDDAILDL